MVFVIRFKKTQKESNDTFCLMIVYSMGNGGISINILGFRPLLPFAFFLYVLYPILLLLVHTHTHTYIYIYIYIYICTYIYVYTTYNLQRNVDYYEMIL